MIQQLNSLQKKGKYMASVTGFMAGGIFGLFVGVFVASAIFAERKDKDSEALKNQIEKCVKQDIGRNEYQE